MIWAQKTCRKYVECDCLVWCSPEWTDIDRDWRFDTLCSTCSHVQSHSELYLSPHDCSNNITDYYHSINLSNLYGNYYGLVWARDGNVSMYEKKIENIQEFAWIQDCHSISLETLWFYLAIKRNKRSKLTAIFKRISYPNRILSFSFKSTRSEEHTSELQSPT